MRQSPRLYRAMLVSLVALASSTGTASAQMTRKAAKPACEGLTIACADTLTPTIAPDGTLWLAARAGETLYVLRSRDGARTFLPTTKIDTQGATLDSGPDARPKLVVEANGTAVLAYATFRDDAFDGEVFTTRSTDGGATFAPPKPITDVQESQRFQDLALDADGSIFAVWLDKRDRVPFKARGAPYPGAGLAYSWSHDGGATFDPAKVILDNTCECCRLGLAFKGPGRPVILFRNIFAGSVRDHAVLTFDAPDRPGAPRRVSTDDWAIDVCPHHGPSLAVAADGSYHAVWFTQGRVRKGLFYAHSEDAGGTFSEPLPLGEPGHASSRPFVLAANGTVYVAWKDYDGTQTRAMLMMSRDGGRVWSPPLALAATTGAADHPILLSDGRHAFLSWQNAGGYRFLDLEAAE